MAHNKGRIPKEVLEDLYLKQHLPFKEIVKKMHRSGTSVCYYLHLYKIPKRGRAKRVPKNDLEEMYIKQKLSLRKICELRGRSREAIRHDLAFYGIPCRVWHGGGKGRGPPAPRLPKDILEKLYLKERKSASEIAEETGRTKRVILLNLAEYGIPRRSIAEARKNGLIKGRIHPLHGESHPFWRGGTSFEPYSPIFNEHPKRESSKKRRLYLSEMWNDTKRVTRKIS